MDSLDSGKVSGGAEVCIQRLVGPRDYIKDYEVQPRFS